MPDNRYYDFFVADMKADEHPEIDVHQMKANIG
jgi:hypothetical protein